MGLMAESLDPDVRGPGEAILDGGATAFLCGLLTLQSYVAALVEHHYNIDLIKVWPCKKPFRFGDDKTLVCQQCCLLPIFLDGSRGDILVYVIPGTTPFLLGRPIMEQLKLSIDFGRKMLKWLDGDWYPATQGKGNHYVVDLLASVDERLHDDPAFILVPDDLTDHCDRTATIPMRTVVQHAAMEHAYSA